MNRIFIYQMASVSVSSESKKLEPRRTSCETLCSSNSSCVLQKRKVLHPLASSIRNRPITNPVTQRVLSAKLLRFKSLQNQLHDANYHIAQLINENKLLKNLQKRQDNALSKYEGANAQLPQVLESHQEELRVLQTKNRSLRKTIKDLADQLKAKDEEINTLRDQNKHMLSLCKNKNLEERGKLKDKVEELTQQLKQSESTITVLNRKLLLETKNYKYKLNSEVTKTKQTQKELSRAFARIEELTAALEGKGKLSEIKLQRKMSGEQKSKSVVNLSGNKNALNSKKTSDNKNENINKTSSLSNLSEDALSNVSSSSKIQPELTALEETNSKSSFETEVETSSEVQLKEIVNSWQKKASTLDNLSDELNKYTLDVLSSAQQSNAMVDKHTMDYKKSVAETETILETLKENDFKNERLQFYDYKILSQKSENTQLMAQFVLNETGDSFEEDLLSETIAHRLSISEPEVDNEDKKKLLAKLKAIDNGDNVIISEVKKSKNELIKELFGS